MSFANNFLNKDRKQLLDTGLDALKTSSKKVDHKTGEFIRNNIAEKIVKPNDVIDDNLRNVEEIIIPLE